ncbi:TIGR02302 family protein [Methylocapsa sp. S129]|uniref:TIGR02302 family protein n=1 Tax=Methylocapsa sp. S129 TaxID=1641869 RepID=UPI001FED553C|nr:TIGR02302 family protein [Methylocapsa sp. S129]
MNEGAETPTPQPHPDADERARARIALDRMARRASLALLWERIWPPLAWALTTGALFLAASWFGLWLDLPAGARIVGLILFAAALLAALYPLALLRSPRRAQTLARIDRDSAAPHQPASSSLDRLADRGAGEATRALWELHQRRLASKIAAIEVAPPAPRMVERDFAALRFGAALLAVCAAFVAGSERYARVAAAFDWRSEAAVAQGFRLDAWIDPPAYTGKPPILLDALGKDAPTQKITTPAGSILVLRAGESIAARVEGALTPATPAKPAGDAAAAQKAPLDPAAGERRWTIKGDGKLLINRDGAPLSTFEITAIANEKPTIALTARPQTNVRGSLTLAYKLADQYGVANAEANFVRPLIDGKAPQGRSLVDPPKMALQLPGGANGIGEAQTTSDLSEHPWAGAHVTMTLSAHNIAGEDGASEPIALTLPQRRFDNPLARALVEQRRDLVLDPDVNRPRVATALDALLIAPEIFETPPSVYLGLKGAQSRLAEARSDQDLIGVADFLWAMALQIEDGDASQAERDLRAAEQKLREALDRGASDEEIRELMKELRAAAEKFTRELAQRPNDQRDLENMTTQDLNSLLDRMEDTARTGDKAQAQAMLDQLQNLFENMKSARSGASPAEKEMRREMGELDKLMRDQQALRDETFRRDQRERKRRAAPGDQPQGEDGQPPDNPDAAQGDQDSDATPLDERQKALRDRLGQLQEGMKGLGLKGEKGFDDAQGAMGEAEGDLKPGGKGKSDAVGEQGRALEALRQGAQGLQKQMQGQGGEGEGVEAVDKPGGQNGRDPLGRDRNGLKGGATDGRLTGAVGAAERAYRVLEELRRRLADPNRPGEERDYLERLLKRD